MNTWFCRFEKTAFTIFYSLGLVFKQLANILKSFTTLRIAFFAIFFITIFGMGQGQAQVLGGCNFQAEITPSGPTTFCGGDSLVLTATQGASYEWSNGATSQSIVVYFPGQYSVTVTDSLGCDDSDDINIIVLPAPFATIIPDQEPPYCEGDEVTLYTTFTPFADYEWSTGETSLSITVTTSDLYSVIITNNFGCADTAELPVIFIPKLPVFTFENGPTTFCEGNSVTLTSSFAFGGTYEWHPNGETTQSITVTESGTYNVTVTTPTTCPSTSDDIEVTVIPLPVADAGNDTVICEEEPITLSATGGESYVWSTGETGEQITVEPSQGINTYVVTASKSGCNPTSMDTVIVEVSSGPAGAFSYSEPYLGEPTTFTDETVGSVYAWDWDFGDGNTSTLVDPSNTYNEEGDFTVTMVVEDEYGCADTVQNTVTIVREIIIPNVFTPNDDGINDIFRIRNGGGGYMGFAVYDRWGNEVYESNASEVQWNGKTNAGIQLGAGTYFYDLTLDIFSDKKPTQHQGFITLIK